MMLITKASAAAPKYNVVKRGERRACNASSESLQLFKSDWYMFTLCPHGLDHADAPYREMVIIRNGWGNALWERLDI